MAARDPLHRDLKPEYCRDFAMLGIQLHLETNSPAILETCSNAFRHFSADPAEPPHFSICLLEDSCFSQTPPWPEPVFRGRRNLFYLSVGSENTAIADLDQGQAIGFLSPAMVRDSSCLRSTIIECLAFTMATHGKSATHSYVHASAVARGNRGLILSGPAGAGKSTLAYACARRGFHIVADDVVYLKRGADKLTAWGNARRLRFAPESLRLFPELSRQMEISGRAPDTDAIEIDTEKILPGCFQPCCEPAALLFLDRSGATCSCDELDPAEAVKLLARDLISDAPETMEMHRRMWIELAGKGSYLLRYGEDLDSVIERLASLLPPRAKD